MRKGFTRKPKPDEPAARGSNYITPGGLQRLKDEHQFLLTRERPAVTAVVTWAASNGDRSENADYQYGKRRLRQIDGQLRFPHEANPEKPRKLVNPETPRTGQRGDEGILRSDRALCQRRGSGASGELSWEPTRSISAANHISWVSPLGRALLKSAAGDSVLLQAPGGTEYLDVLEVCYERISVEPFREPPGSESSSRKLPR